MEPSTISLSDQLLLPLSTHTNRPISRWQNQNHLNEAINEYITTENIDKSSFHAAVPSRFKTQTNLGDSAYSVIYLSLDPSHYPDLEQYRSFMDACGHTICPSNQTDPASVIHYLTTTLYDASSRDLNTISHMSFALYHHIQLLSDVLESTSDGIYVLLDIPRGQVKLSQEVDASTSVDPPSVISPCEATTTPHRCSTPLQHPLDFLRIQSIYYNITTLLQNGIRPLDVWDLLHFITISHETSAVAMEMSDTALQEKLQSNGITHPSQLSIPLTFSVNILPYQLFCSNTLQDLALPRILFHILFSRASHLLSHHETVVGSHLASGSQHLPSVPLPSSSHLLNIPTLFVQQSLPTKESSNVLSIGDPLPLVLLQQYPSYLHQTRVSDALGHRVHVVCTAHLYHLLQSTSHSHLIELITQQSARLSSIAIDKGDSPFSYKAQYPFGCFDDSVEVVSCQQQPAILSPSTAKLTANQVCSSEATSTFDQYKHGCFGGSFDYLHLGHATLLLALGLSTTQSAVIGVTAPPLLTTKSHSYLIQPWHIRVRNLLGYFALVKGYKHTLTFPLEQLISRIKLLFSPSLVQTFQMCLGTQTRPFAVTIEPLIDMFGPSAQVHHIDCLFLSDEVKQGGYEVLTMRQLKGLPLCDLYSIPLVIPLIVEIQQRLYAQRQGSSLPEKGLPRNPIDLKLSSTRIRQFYADMNLWTPQ